MSWTRPMLTDSGGFQVFSLAKLRKVSPEGVQFQSHLDGSTHFFSPEHSMAVQIALGADIMMVFDECVETPASWERTRDSMALTHDWARRSKQYWVEHRDEVPWARASQQGASQRAFAGKHQSLSASCRAVCTPTCAASPLSGWWRWTSPATPSAGWRSASRARSRAR